MLPTEVSIAQSIASSVTATTTYILLCLVVGFLIHFFHLLDFFDIPNTYKMIIAILIPIVLLEFILSIVFGSVGIPLDWGSYVYHFPYFGDIVITSGVQISKFLDTIFNFGLFRIFGMPYFTEFIKTVPVGEMVMISVPEGAGLFELIGVVFSGWLGLLTWLCVSFDSIIDFIFFFVLFSAIFAVFGENVKNAKIYIIGLACIPVLLYSYYISNPFQEFPIVLVSVQEIFYFWGHADGLSLFMFFGTLIVSFVLVTEIIALVIYLFLKGGAVTLQPSWSTKEWSVSQHGIAFGYCVAFFTMYFLHNYQWFVFFPLMITYSLLKRVSGTAIDTMNAHAEKQEIRDLISGIGNNNGQQLPIKSTLEKKNIIEYVLYIGIIGMILLLLYNTGII